MYCGSGVWEVKIHGLQHDEYQQRNTSQLVTRASLAGQSNTLSVQVDDQILLLLLMHTSAELAMFGVQRTTGETLYPDSCSESEPARVKIRRPFLSETKAPRASRLTGLLLSLSDAAE